VLKLELPWIDGLVTPKRPTYVPVVFSQREVQILFDAIEGTWRLIAQFFTVAFTIKSRTKCRH
jgi:hypothetical protein